MSPFSAAMAAVFLFHLTCSLPLKRSASPGRSAADPIKCAACIELVEVIQHVMESNGTFEEFYPLAVEVCELALDKLKLNGKYMCPGTMDSYGPAVQYVAARIVLDPWTVCQNFHFCQSWDPVNSTKEECPWPSLQEVLSKPRSSVPLRNHPSLLTEDAPSVSLYMLDDKLPPKKPVTPDPKTGKITFVQISDIHLDKFYVPASPTDCGLYFCCRPWYNGTGSAGHYGEYNCDLPHPTLELLLDQIENLVPFPDFIIYTGDNPPHDLWNQTWSSQIAATSYVVDRLAERFPNTSIYPCIGNHETWPQSEYMGTLKEYQALTHKLSVMWRNWMNMSKEIEMSIASGGYYVQPVIKGKFKIVSFNSNYGYLLNFYAFLNPENPHYKYQWQWLNSTLSEARSKGEKVLLIGHIPPGDLNNLPDYGRSYLNITRDFKDTIIGHLYGHTHMDHFQLIQDEAGVYGVVLVAPSVTPFGHINPSFRTFTMDTDPSMQLLDYTQYHLDLQLANDLYARGYEGQVRFEPIYSSSEGYKLQNLSPLAWSRLAKEFQTDSDLLNDYYYNRHGQSYDKEKVCDASCRKDMLCEVNNIIGRNVVLCNVNS